MESTRAGSLGKPLPRFTHFGRGYQHGAGDTNLALMAEKQRLMDG